MRISSIHIKNFKSIEEMTISDVDNALILVGKNNSGKSIILDAIRAVTGDYEVSEKDFHEATGNIVMDVKLEMYERDLAYLHSQGVVSKYKHYDLWLKEFMEKLPTFEMNEEQNGGTLTFQYVYRRDGVVKYRDSVRKNNTYIKSVLPKIYYVDHSRNKSNLEKDLNLLYGRNEIDEMRSDKCLFDGTKNCTQCFSCIGYINQKKPEDLSLCETVRLMQYKLFNANLNTLSEKLNRNFAKNGANNEEIQYQVDFDAKKLLSISTFVKNTKLGTKRDIQHLGEGLKSIYILSLLETYVETQNVTPYIVLIEEPEIYLHPQLQKVASEILYRLTKKNQVIFSTHAPVMLFNFMTRQIRQIFADEGHGTSVRKVDNIDKVLDDLGYTANDLMNVSFVFIVEGKQDRNRLPLLLKKYYSEIMDDRGHLSRVAIIATNSCTNIKTYANLKYINSLYLKDAFLMIRDSDGKNPSTLRKQLCGYYEDRAREDLGNLPRVTAKNVLILKYYSFENYFLDPEVMTKIGVVKDKEQFFDILYAKYKEYLYKLSSTKRMLEKLKITIETREDIINNLENIRIYVRGHNLYDIFYGRYKGDKEQRILTRYIEEAPRETFADILEAIDRFVYFNSHRES